MKSDESKNNEIFHATGRKNLGLVLIYCAGRLLESDRLQGALTLLACVKILTPKCDVRHLQALTHYCMDDYLEALQLLQGLDHMPARALAALCQRAVGEPSWLGVAEQVCESGDLGAIELLAPWMEGSISGDPGDPHEPHEPPAMLERADAEPCPFAPLRA